MGKQVVDGGMDALLAWIAACDQLDVVTDTATPTDLTGSIASVAMTPGDGNGDYAIADGDTDGRKVTVAEQANLDVTGDGSARHIVLSASGTVRFVTTCTVQALETGNKVTVPSFKHTVRDSV